MPKKKVAKKIYKRVVRKKKKMGIRDDGSFYWRSGGGKGNWMLYLGKKQVKKVKTFANTLTHGIVGGALTGLSIYAHHELNKPDKQIRKRRR